MWPWTYRARVGVWTANASDKIVRPWQESKVDVSLELDLKQTWKEQLLSQDLKVWKCASLHRVFVCLGNGHNCRWSTQVGPSPRSLQPTPIVQPSWVAPRKRQEKPCTAEPQARRLRDTGDHKHFFQFLFTVCSRDLSPVPLGKHYKKMKFKFECGLSNTNWKLHLYELYKRHLLSVDSGKTLCQSATRVSHRRRRRYWRWSNSVPARDVKCQAETAKTAKSPTQSSVTRLWDRIDPSNVAADCHWLPASQALMAALRS